MERCFVCNEDMAVGGVEMQCRCSKWKSETIADAWEWQEFKKEYEPISAFTVAELGVILNPYSAKNQDCDNLFYTVGDFGQSEKKEEVAGFSVWNFDQGRIVINRVFKTEAEARAALLIFLLENKIITAEEINAKLI